jgi:glycerol-3-phosphate dehydrogenase
MSKKFAVLTPGQFGAANFLKNAHNFNHPDYKGDFKEIVVWMKPGTPCVNENDGDLMSFIDKHRTLDGIFDIREYPDLAGIKIPDNVSFDDDLERVANHANILEVATPGKFLTPYLPRLARLEIEQIVNLSKGIVEGDIAKKAFDHAWGDKPLAYAVLSGPMIAAQIVMGYKMMTEGQDGREWVASANLAQNDLSQERYPDLIQILSHSPLLRLYECSSVEAVEYCGILKQVYAIFLGMCEGAGYPTNTIAGVFGSCKREMKRILHQKGYDPEVIHELCGEDDLLLTYLSGRHGNLGRAIGKHRDVQKGLKTMKGKTLEGMLVIEALIKQYGKRILRPEEMPSTGKIHLPILGGMGYLFLNPDAQFDEVEKNLKYALVKRNA